MRRHFLLSIVFSASLAIFLLFGGVTCSIVILLMACLMPVIIVLTMVFLHEDDRHH